MTAPARYADKISPARRAEIAAILADSSQTFPETPATLMRAGAPWSAYEDAHIIHLRSVRNLRTPVVAAIIGRTIATTRDRFRKLDVLVFERRPWTEEDYACVLKLLLEDELTFEAAGAAVDRTAEQVRSKLDYHGVKLNRRPLRRETEDACAEAHTAPSNAPASYVRFSDWEIAKIKESDSPEEAAALTGRTLEQIKNKAYAIGKTWKVVCHWTDDVCTRLGTALETLGEDFVAIAKELGTSPRQVRTKAIALGLIAKKRERRGLTEAAKVRVDELAKDGIGITAVAKRLRCDLRTLKAYAASAEIAFAPVVRAKPKKAIVVKAIMRAQPPAPAKAAKPMKAVKPMPAKPPIPAKPEKMTKARPAKPVRVLTPAPVPEVRIAISAARPVPVAPAAKPIAEPKVAAVLPALPAPARVNLVAKPVEAPFDYRKAHGWRQSKPQVRVAMSAEDVHAAVAKHLREKGVTRFTEEPRDEIVNAIRARGYSVVHAGKGYLIIDSRIRVADNFEALRDFAEKRAIRASCLEKSA